MSASLSMSDSFGGGISSASLMNEMSQLAGQMGMGGMGGASSTGAFSEFGQQGIAPQNMHTAMELTRDAMRAGRDGDPGLEKHLLKQALEQLEQGEGAGQVQPGQGSDPLFGPQGDLVPAQSSSPDTGSFGNAPVDSGAGSDAGMHSSTPLTENGNSVNTGMYTISAGTKDDGSLTITNNQTGQSTEVWGDPHVNVNGQNVAEFQKGPMNIQLQDGTTVHIDPTQMTNGVAHIGQVSITKGDQSVEMGGVGANGFQGGVNTSAVQTGDAKYQSSLYNAPDAVNVTLGADGNLYHNNANGSMGAEITAQANGSQTDLDGTGGGLVNQPASGGSGESMQQIIAQMQQILGSSASSFGSSMMQNMLSHIQHQTQDVENADA